MKTSTGSSFEVLNVELLTKPANSAISGLTDLQANTILKPSKLIAPRIQLTIESSLLLVPWKYVKVLKSFTEKVGESLSDTNCLPEKVTWHQKLEVLNRKNRSKFV